MLLSRVKVRIRQLENERTISSLRWSSQGEKKFRCWCMQAGQLGQLGPAGQGGAVDNTEENEDHCSEPEDNSGSFEEVEDIEDSQLHTIRPGLYLGSMHSETDAAALTARGVTHILQVGEGLTPTHEGIFVYKQIHVDDDEREDIVAHFQKCFDFIEDAHSSPGTGKCG